MKYWQIFILYACTRDKVIGRVVVVVVHKKNCQILGFRHLSNLKVQRKAVEVTEKLASGCLESRGTAYKLHK